MLTDLRQADRRKVLIAGGLILLLVGGWSVFGPYGALRYYRIASELDKILNENERLRQSNTALYQELTKLKTDQSYLDDVARRQFGLVRKNEIIYELPEKKKRHE